METWQKVLLAITMVMMIVFLFPRAKHAMENAPKATGKDWQGVLIPLVVVVLFIVLLVNLV
jgi:hypothetical protein